MIVLLSGEGPSDLGTAEKHGPLFHIINNVLEFEWGFEPEYQYISEAKLKNESKKLDNRERRHLSRGKKMYVETKRFYKAAFVIAMEAEKLSSEKRCVVVSVLFRDSDGTNSSQRDLWERQRASMMNGFLHAEYKYGVPMIPRPKSEAWLLCCFQKNKFQNCDRFEDFSGNDGSPNSAKAQLAASLGVEINDIYDKKINPIADSIPWNNVNMSSFNSFMERLKEIASLALKR